jgi:hypothetical protein
MSVPARAGLKPPRRVQVTHALSRRGDQANAGLVLRRPDDPSRSGVDLLLVDVALFPPTLLGLSLLGLLGQYPSTYDAVVATCATSSLTRPSCLWTAPCAKPSSTRERP